MELIKVFNGQASRALIGVKGIGELIGKVFVEAAKRKHPKDASTMGAQLCSLWESYLKDPHWNPFRENIINEEDEKLIRLRNEYGDEPYEAVKDALLEMNRHRLNNPTGGYSMLELWNNKEERIATTNEGIEYLIKQWGAMKKKR